MTPNKITVDFGSHIVRRIDGVAQSHRVSKSFIVRRCVLYALGQVAKELQAPNNPAEISPPAYTPAAIKSNGIRKGK